MLYLLASAVCSVLVSVLLKLAPRLRVDVGQAIAWNYLVAAGLTALVLGARPAGLRAAGVPWMTLGVLGVLLPVLFLLLAGAVRHAGIVRSEVAQRLSLVLSLLAAFVLFGEPAPAGKLAGVALGLLALPAMFWRGADARRPAGGPTAAGWTYPVLVFLGFAAVDVLFKRIALAGLPLGSALLGVFMLALLVALAWQGGRWARGRTRPAWRHLAAGLVLGLLNFGNILFYLRAHRALPAQPALVFAGMNLGVVALGTLAGVGVFGERLTWLNRVGLGLAILAIGVLARASLG